ncbi:SseB family protein [Microbacterium invictum]|uniref:SseB protein N-terminal domain-containing protein n=1 Tax=Microbacterium invictum TaxID=515415 RepID=A0AA40SPE2_9MICO|nr:MULTISPECIES: SseB family protein [Microbacterium]MBB4139928.1 hypothetical protein [Microbacterium invictum]
MALFSRRSKAQSETPSADAPGPDDAVTSTDNAVVTDAGAVADGAAGAVADGTPGAADRGMSGAVSANSDSGTPEAVAADTASDTGDAAVVGATEPETPAEPVPHVNISVSTYGKPAASTPPASTRKQPPAEAPAQTEKVPGLPDNVVLRSALAALPEKPGNLDIMNAMRQSLQGNLYVRVRGDAKSLLAEGKQLTLAVSAIDDKRFLLAFTGGEALQRSIASDGDTKTSAVGQPAQVVLRNVIEGPYAGLIIDHATPQARIILPSQLIQKSVEEADEGFPLKNLLARPRTDATAADIADALTRAKFWVAAGKADDSARVGLAEVRTEAGARLLQIFSHPLEVLVQGRDERPLPLTAEQLGKALAADPDITGILLDPAGPWITLTRDDLAPVIALAG